MNFEDQVIELEDEIDRLEAENNQCVRTLNQYMEAVQQMVALLAEKDAEIERFKTLTSQLSYRVSSLQDECNLLRADMVVAALREASRG
jgi:hypothetical protein